MVICKKKKYRGLSAQIKRQKIRNSTGPQVRGRRRGKGSTSRRGKDPRVHTAAKRQRVHESTNPRIHTAAKGQRVHRRRGKGSTNPQSKGQRSTSPHGSEEAKGPQIHGRRRDNEGAKIHESTGPRLEGAGESTQVEGGSQEASSRVEGTGPQIHRYKGDCKRKSSTGKKEQRRAHSPSTWSKGPIL